MYYDFRDMVSRSADKMIRDLGDAPSRAAVLDLLQSAEEMGIKAIWDAAPHTLDAHGWTAVHNPYTLTIAELEQFPDVTQKLLFCARLTEIGQTRAIAPNDLWETFMEQQSLGLTLH